MIAVIGLIAVTGVITLTITSATVSAVGYTSLSRAGVQSEAAADAGVQAMLAALADDACPADGLLEIDLGEVDASLTGTAAAAPFFSAQLFQRADAAASWVPGCPDGTTGQIRVQSTGFANDAGVTQSASGQDSAAVEAVYDWEPGEVTAEASGAAVFSFGTPGLSNSLELLSFEGNQANVLVRNGNILCSNSVFVEGDIVAANGNIQLDNTCTAGGNVWASGTVTLQGNKTIGGNVIAVGGGQSTFDPNVRVDGGIWVGGTINTWGQRCSSGATGWDAAGNACALARSSGADPVLYNQSGLPAPVVPEWVDVAYVPQTWRDAGWNVVTYTGNCTIDNRTKSDAPVVAFSSYTTPTVIDVRHCSNFVISSSAGLNISLKTDLAFITPTNVNLENFTLTPSGVGNRQVRFITPDSVADQQPTTTGCGRFDINNRNDIVAPVAVLIYTPCRIQNSNQLSWRGQNYGGTVTFSNNSQLVYVPIGVPGYDLNGLESGGGGGGGGGEGTPGTVGSLLEYRDIAVPS